MYVFYLMFLHVILKNPHHWNISLLQPARISSSAPQTHNDEKILTRCANAKQ